MNSDIDSSTQKESEFKRNMVSGYIYNKLGIQIPREDNKNKNGNEDITIFCRDYHRHTLNSPITKNKELYLILFLTL